MDKVIEMFSLTGNPWWDIPLLSLCAFLSIVFVANR